MIDQEFIDKYNSKIDCGKKAYFRGGYMLKNILSKPEKYLSGEDILSIFNTYGIHPRELVLLILSHGCEGDFDRFIELIWKQIEISKDSIQCYKEFGI